MDDDQVRNEDVRGSAEGPLNPFIYPHYLKGHTQRQTAADEHRVHAQLADTVIQVTVQPIGLA